ncbi:MAG: dephospho-CoA kinase [Gammaproteobacteria bacterium]|nr:MAG: dephospho-CoA kinase [Gammaproteobacteria bacterium]
MRIGLTGGIGSGKSTVASLFSALGIPVFDADDIVHTLLQHDTPTYSEIVSTFGNNIVLQNMELDRKKLREIIFNDTSKRKALEQILHPRVYDVLINQSDKEQAPYCILSIPLLFETNGQANVDRVLVIDSDIDQQIRRTVKRDQLAAAEVHKIIDSQIERSKRLALADDVIHNDGSTNKLHKQVERLHKQYLALSCSG